MFAFCNVVSDSVNIPVRLAAPQKAATAANVDNLGNIGGTFGRVECHSEERSDEESGSMCPEIDEIRAQSSLFLLRGQMLRPDPADAAKAALAESTESGLSMTPLAAAITQAGPDSDDLLS